MIARILLGLCSACWLAGCGCTDIGCGDVLTIQTTLNASRIEVNDGEGDVRVCRQGEECWKESTNGSRSATFYFAPLRTGVRVLSSSGAVLSEISVQPDYAVEAPNGEGCPPTCRTAVLAVP